MAEVKFDKFFDYFEEYEDSYVVIGGNATAFWLEQDRQNFRMTKDYDIVVIFEQSTDEFSEKFSSFISENHYQRCEVGRDEEKKKVYYRYRLDPEHPSEEVPQEIELFSRKPMGYLLEETLTETTPLHYEDGPSLSAIILDDDYYQLLKECQEKIGNISVLSVPGLIYFKARAHLDVKKRVENGEKINHRANKTKHFNDVCRLCSLVSDESRVNGTIPDSCQSDLREFIELVDAVPDRDFRLRFKAEHDFELSKMDVLDTLYSLLPNQDVTEE